jgi:ribose-phosphate pyrophosphokinase
MHTAKIIYGGFPTMANNYVFHDSLPVAPLKLAALESCMDLATQVNDHIVSFRRNDIEELLRRKEDLNYRGYDVDSYLLDLKCPRFGSGEAKAVINESVRGADIFAMVDVTNYSLTYNVSGFTNHMSPDDHFQDLKRIIGSSVATAHRVNVIMPFLYEGRQHKRTKRESLDCAMALEELVNMGVSNIITFDAHDPRVQNSIPLSGFDNFMPTYQFVKTLLNHDPDLQLDKDHLMVISPDEGAMDRAVYLANNLSVDMGMFYKRRDYSTVINGRNPIVAHEFLGASVEDKTVLIIDDMISSGESMLDTAKALKDRKAKKVIICCTFGLFTNGLEKFDEFYNKGYIDYVITTNLNYRPKELMEREWYLEANMSKYLAAIVNSFNHDISIGAALSPTIKIQKLLQKFHAGKTE